MARGETVGMYSYIHTQALGGTQIILRPSTIRYMTINWQHRPLVIKQVAMVLSYERKRFLFCEMARRTISHIILWWAEERERGHSESERQ
jgi:hypothetical protein